MCQWVFMILKYIYIVKRNRVYIDSIENFFTFTPYANTRQYKGWKNRVSHRG